MDVGRVEVEDRAAVAGDGPAAEHEPLLDDLALDDRDRPADMSWSWKPVSWPLIHEITQMSTWAVAP